MMPTMRILVVVSLCLCSVAPSTVLSITLREGEFADPQMPAVGENGREERKFNTIAKSLIRTVLNAAEEGEVGDNMESNNLGEMTVAKRAGVNRPERELRRSFPLGRRNQVTSRANQVTSRASQLTNRAKFIFGKRSSLQDNRSKVEKLLEDLEKEATVRNQDELGVFGNADLFNIPEGNRVQKDALSVLSFGKRAMPAFSYGKRGMPGFTFGKRGLPSFTFGKRGHNGPAFTFGRREWLPAEQELDAPEMGPHEIKRKVAFFFGKRENQ